MQLDARVHCPRSPPHPSRALRTGALVPLRTVAEAERLSRRAPGAIRHRDTVVLDEAVPTGYPAGDEPTMLSKRPTMTSGAAPGSDGRHRVGLGPVTTSVVRGSGHQTGPETRKPRCSAVSEALCRTRTGDPFLTMAVRPCLEAFSSGRSGCKIRESGCRSRLQRSARFDTRRYPLGTRARTAFGARVLFATAGSVASGAAKPARRTPPCRQIDSELSVARSQMPARDELRSWRLMLTAARGHRLAVGRYRDPISEVRARRFTTPPSSAAGRWCSASPLRACARTYAATGATRRRRSPSAADASSPPPTQC